jgi:hypothetical protein
VRVLTFVVLALALVGCGSSSSDHEASAPPATPPPGPATTPVSAPAKLPSACNHRAQAAIPGGSVTADPSTARSGADSCRLENGELSAVVYLDSAPQAYTRMEREIVEFGQNVDWTKVPTSAYPQTVKHLGLDASWFPMQNRLLTTDGVRLVTIKLHSELPAREKQRIAVAMARTYLGPNRHP